MRITGRYSVAAGVSAAVVTLALLAAALIALGASGLTRSEAASPAGASAGAAYALQSDPDADGDGVPDASDNCPAWPNPGQDLPPWPVPVGDADCDAWTDADEALITTDAGAACGFTAGAPTQSETWPPDLMESNSINIFDVLELKPVFGTSVPPTSARFDILPGSGIDTFDVLEMKRVFGLSCTLPVTADGYRMSNPIPNVDFSEMIGMAVVPGQPDVAIVITQAGLLYRISVSGAFTPAPFGDISAMVTRNGDEGLLAIVFEPGHADHVYLNYTTGAEYYQPVVPTGTPSPTTPPDPKRNVISRFDIVNDELDLASERIIIEVLEPADWHNVNEMVFGPDGMMYVGAGDGGGLNAQYDADHGQGTENLLATIFRIDPLPGGGYDIPPDNPFFGVPGAAEEVWAYGLRNPWRLSFDSETGDLWTGDVGEFYWEEVDRVIKGKNYGWEIIEGEYDNPDGFFCHGLHVNCTPPPNYEDPRTAYCHTFVTNCEFKSPAVVDVAIIGGYVYRGSEMPELYGWYIYADHGSARIRGFDASDDSSEPIVLAGSAGAPCQGCVRSFVQLADGELLVLTAPHGGDPGAIYRFQRVP